MTASRPVELEGHIIDSGIMEQCFGLVMDMDGSFEVERFDVGTRKDEESYARMTVTGDDEAHLREILHELHQNGATLVDPSDATLVPAPADGVVPPNFYSTTNHPTDVRYDGEWLPVEHVEMDAAVVVEPGTDSDSDRPGDSGDHGTLDDHDDPDGVSGPVDPDDPTDASDPAGSDDPENPDDADPDGRSGPRARTKVLNVVREGDLVVTGEAGIRVKPPERPRDASGPFGFMRGGVSSERPSESLVEQVADAIAGVRAEDGTVLVVPGPAVVHSGGGEHLARMVREGYVDALSAGNGFAVHDLEQHLYGTSLGMDVETLDHPRKGHKHHIYTISRVVRAGGIEPAIDDGLVESGVMYECVTNDVPYVLAGSIRDDGPLPDTITDAVEAQAAIREQAREADLVVMLATLLHSVAVGNCLPSTTPTVCVDIDSDTVTQLLDRGSAQAVGMVTDVGMFLPRLAEALDGD